MKKSSSEWNTVQEYLSDDLASDSKENKKLKAAETVPVESKYLKYKIILFLLLGKSIHVTKHCTISKVFLSRLFVPSSMIIKPISSTSQQLPGTRPIKASKTATTARALFWMWKTGSLQKQMMILPRNIRIKT